MKRKIAAVFAAVISIAAVLFLFAGCGGGNNGSDENDNTAKKTYTTEKAKKNEKANTREDTEAAAANGTVDLTSMSSTAVFAEVWNIMTDPDSYIGKTIKMKGKCSIAEDQESGKTHYACIVKDAAGCCRQGIEFRLKRNSAYPADGSNVTVKGVFATYKEGGDTYAYLKRSALE